MVGAVGATNALVGFSGATGGAWAEQHVSNFSFVVGTNATSSYKSIGDILGSVYERILEHTDDGAARNATEMMRFSHKVSQNPYCHVSLSQSVSSNRNTSLYDIIITIETPDPRDIGRLVMNEIHGVTGIKRTVTCLAI